MKRSETNDYLRMLFGKILERVIAKDYAKTAENRKNYAMTEAYQDDDTMTDASGEAKEEVKRPSQIQKKSSLIVNPSEEEMKSDPKIEEATPEDIILILEDIIKKMSKKLVFMPISIRYLCKLTENLAKTCVNSLLKYIFT